MRTAVLLSMIALGASCHSPGAQDIPTVARPDLRRATERAEGLPERIVIVEERTEPDDPPEPEWRWGRAEALSGDGRYQPNRSDWHDNPASWELLAVDAVSAIPESLRPALARLDCRIPRFRHTNGEGGVIWGEFERPGQRDIAILCVHPDHSSSTHVFWQADPTRMETIPHSGSSISTMSRDIVAAAAAMDPSRPSQPDMPDDVDHDGIDIGCCECCSTIFYRHNGKWFTLPGAD